MMMTIGGLPPRVLRVPRVVNRRRAGVVVGAARMTMIGALPQRVPRVLVRNRRRAGHLGRSRHMFIVGRYLRYDDVL